MNAAPKKTGGIKEMDKRYFREIFGLHAKDDKINYEGLCKIFEMVDFKPNEKQEVEFKAMFSKKEEISFNGKPALSDTSVDFLSIFNLKSNQKYNQVDVKNAFRVSKMYVTACLASVTGV